MSTEKFRRQLKDEVEGWWKEGTIDSAVYEQLAERYQFRQIESATSRRFITILLGIGGILLGLGMITLVAANWQAWSRPLRMGVVFGTFVIVNVAGFYLWRRPMAQPGLQRLGHGLLLTGALVMGANLGLMSQMFHQGGAPATLYLVWGLGVLAMAYGLRLTSLGILSWILICVSHGTVMFDGAAGMTSVGGAAWLSSLQTYLPLLITPLYLPLAHWCRSPVLYSLWGVGVLAILSSNETLVDWNAALLAATIVVLPILLWVYHAGFWRWPADQLAALTAERSHPMNTGKQTAKQRQEPTAAFQSLGRSLAICFVSVAVYSYSFQEVWTEVLRSEAPVGAASKTFMMALIGLWALALYGGWQCFLHDRQRPEGRSLWMKTPVFAAVVALIGLGVFCQFQGFVSTSRSVGTGALALIVVMNAALFFIGFAMVHDGMVLGIRSRFWGGMGLVVLGITTRMFEYNTGLMLKALVLTACGVGIIVAGLWFEKQAKSSLKITSTEMEKA